MSAAERDRNGAGAPTDHGEVARIPLLADLRAGTRLGGYELLEIAGRGGMGVVYRARHVHLDRIVALKLLGPEAAHDARFRDRFLRESRTAASLEHPAIVRVYDAGEAEGILYIAMQFVEGADLSELLEDERPLEVERALSLLEQVADGLDAAHTRGLVHRDVKPANILVDGDRALLSDFGLTRHVASQTALTSHGQTVGTVDYMAPEQIEGTVIDSRVDVYALGCVLYQTLTGIPPFRKDSHISSIYAHLRESPPSVSAARSELPASLDAVIERALAKQKDDRPATCSELIRAARAAVSGAPAAPPPPAERRPSQDDARTVLLVGADRALRSMMRATFARSAYRVLEADAVAGAAALTAEETPDLVVVERALARELTPQLGAAGPQRAKVVVVGDRHDRAGARPLGQGADAAIARPFSSLQLLITADELLAASPSRAPAH